MTCCQYLIKVGRKKKEEEKRKKIEKYFKSSCLRELKNGSSLQFCGNGVALFSIDRMDLHFQFDCWNWSFDTASSLSRCGLGSEHNHHNFTGINVIPHDYLCDR